MSEEQQIAGLREDFYRDSFGKVILINSAFLGAIAILLALIFYLYLQKPLPVTFAVGDEWRVQPAVPLDQPYLSTPDVLQWVSNVIPNSFMLNFVNYNDQLKSINSYFTDDGLKIFLNQLNIYANYNNVQTNKLFITGAPAAAPTLLNQGMLSGRYGWWVQMPLNLSTNGPARSTTQTLTLQVLVVRVPTLNNLNGVAIDNVIVATSQGT